MVLDANRHDLSDTRSTDLVDALDAIAWEADPRTLQFTWVSATAERVLGYPINRWLRERSFWRTLLHRDDHPTWVLLRGMQSDKETIEREYRAISAAGETIWLKCVARLRVNERTGTAMIRGVMTDITSVKERETELVRNREELRESLSLLRSTLESTADGILVVNRERRIVGFNNKFRDMWELPDELLRSGQDRAALELVRAQLVDPEAFESRVKQLYDNPETETFDVLEFKDGRVFERYSQPQRMGDAIVGRVWSFRDVTQRMRLEEQLRHSQKMDAVGRLAGGVAHDFNNLLQVIQSAAESLSETLDDADARRAEVDAVLRAGQSGASLVRRLLAFSRQEIARPRVIDVNEVLVDLEELLRRSIGEDVVLSMELSPNLWATRIDPGHIEQIVINLAVNSKDAMPSGGKLIVATANSPDGRARPETLASGDFVRLTVSDTGHGISEGVAPNVFEPFFTTKMVGKGSGLGLSTVRRIVEEAGGHISFSSTAGVGTSFDIFLPAIRRSAVHPGSDGDDRPAGAPSRQTVLLVEDQEEVLTFLSSTLERHGYDVISALSSEAAIEHCKHSNRPIDVLVTDVVMPGMTGIELARRVKRTKGARVVLMSGYSGNRIDAEDLGNGSGFFLEKPFSVEQLLEAIDRSGRAS